MVESIKARDLNIHFDFSALQFVDPMGTTMLACLLSTAYRSGADISLIGLDVQTKGTHYLGSAGFFEVLGSESGQRVRQLDTTVEFTAIQETNHVAYVHQKLKPWIQREVNLSLDTVDSLVACIAEALQNIEHHGGAIGFCIAQHYPKISELRIAVSDCGYGIPALVRRVIPAMTDGPALVKACERGFSTKSNVRNRGYGLDNLIHYAVLNNGGSVQIRSGLALLKASRQGGRVTLHHTATPWRSIGTAVQISLRTDTLEHADNAAASEAFEWY